jgi:hypothetical protein
MLSPRRSLAFGTILVVLFVAAYLWVFRSRVSVTSQNSAAVSAARSLDSLGKNSSGASVAGTNQTSTLAPEATDLAKFTFATFWGREKEPALAAFSQWAVRYTNASSNLKNAMLPEGIALARERRVAFRDLIRRQPKRALAETVPALVRNELPQSILELLENRVTGQGDFIALGRTDPANDQTASRRAEINGREYEAFVYGDRLSQQTRSNVSLHGVALDGQLALSDSPLRVFEAGEPIPADKPLAAESCPISGQPTAPTRNGPRPNAVAAESGTHIYWMCHGNHVAAAAEGVGAQEFQFAFQSYNASGVRSALVMMVDFDDLPGASSPTATVDATMNAVDQFLSQASYGDLQLSSHTITPVLRMPKAKRVYSNPSNLSGDATLLNDARDAARAAGFNPDSFDFDMVAFGNIGMPWSGQGYVGSKGAWIQGDFVGSTLGHELGHNLGVWHANSWNSTESPISPNGAHTEYGNPFDVMGRTVSGFPFDHYSANFKHLLGWLSADNIIVVNGSGTFRVYAHDENSRILDRIYALNIPVGIAAGGEIEDYWIEFRQLLTNQYPATASGAIIQWGNDSGSKSGSRLLDMNFSTTTKTDAPLAIGKTFNDPDRGLQITTLGKGGSDADAYLDIQIALIIPPIVELADAVDNTNLVWTTSTAAWTGQRGVTHDGVDAAASGSIGNSSETYLETTVEGPGALFFWWKVSSEETFDFLKFAVDGQTLASISGEVNWQQRGYDLDTGTHTIRWTYSKDAGTVSGADRGWVDQVNFVSGDYAPFVNTQPAAVSATIGDIAQFHIDAIGSAPLTYRWQKISSTGQPVAVPNGTNDTLTIYNVQDSDAGQYNCVVQNDVGTLTSSNAVLIVTHVISLAEALDNSDTNITWSTSGASDWSGQEATSFDGSDAAQSGHIADGKDSTLNATITGPGTLSFWWKVSSEPEYDQLSLYLDGNLIENHAGEFGWSQKAIVIPNGIHKVRWAYTKDGGTSGGEDAAWVDEAQFTPFTGVASQFVEQPGPQAVSIGGTALFTAEYTADKPISFTWTKDGAPLDPARGYIGLNTDTLEITNVQPSDAGTYNLTIANSFGATSSDVAPLSIVTISLADALDQPTRAFLTGGFADWFPETASTHDGIDAARAGLISDDQFTWIETHITGPATVTFWWKVSSELEYDFLSLELDTIAIPEYFGPGGLEKGKHFAGAGRSRAALAISQRL